MTNRFLGSDFPQQTPLSVETITSGDRLAAAVQAMRLEPAIALDTESNSFFRYPEQLCLVQIATSRAVAIIDPIALGEVTPLKEMLANSAVQKVLHGADYDVRSLDRAWGSRMVNLYDTNIAARFAGMTQLGLASLAEVLLGVKLNKEKRLQRADWGRRPLSSEALEYAASDVRHLLAIRDLLEERLRLLGRTAWVVEECARLEGVRYEPPDPETAFLTTKGSRDLSPRGLAVLRALHAFREREALRRGRPPFHVLGDSTLVHLAAKPEAELAETPGLSTAVLQRLGHSLREAISEGMGAPPFHRPPPSRPREDRLTQEQMSRLQKLKAWRSALGERLSMDPSLLWPMAGLQQLAREPGAELAAPEVRTWQRQEFEGSLRAVLAEGS